MYRDGHGRDVPRSQRMGLPIKALQGRHDFAPDTKRWRGGGAWREMTGLDEKKKKYPLYTRAGQASADG